jgi:hypothetical protein
MSIPSHFNSGNLCSANNSSSPSPSLSHNSCLLRPDDSPLQTLSFQTRTRRKPRLAVYGYENGTPTRPFISIQILEKSQRLLTKADRLFLVSIDNVHGIVALVVLNVVFLQGSGQYLVARVAKRTRNDLKISTLVGVGINRRALSGLERSVIRYWFLHSPRADCQNERVDHCPSDWDSPG